MTRARGCPHPETATDAASVVRAPPWRCSGDLLTVEPDRQHRP
ncbi:hypothetical protein [Streptomyces silvensis]